MVLLAIVCSAAGTYPWLYLVVLAAAVCVHGHTLRPLGAHRCSCVCFVVWCAFCVFPCGALFLGGLFPLMLSHTLLVSWRPRPMHSGDDSGCALLLAVVQSLCSFGHALRTGAPFPRAAAWCNVVHTWFGGRHVLVASTPCCLVVLLLFLVLGRAQVRSSYCMHFAKCFGARNVQLFRLGGSCVCGFL